ncbi:AFG1/ZapE family ATPase [Paeniglutamicibacter antarcticus]|uniref:AFG1/ZapE family ATPase n=1 Tax=Paeniglutamicibacter antarcticus TaxID=494023 RepID=UPI001AE53BE5
MAAPGPRQLQQIGLNEPLPGETVILKPTSHEILSLQAIHGMLSFKFSDLCEPSTATLDYLELSNSYDHWVISGNPDAETMTAFGLRRLAKLIDVLYDREIRLDLLVTADSMASLHHLPPSDAARLTSRLNALQSPATSPDTESATA